MGLPLPPLLLRQGQKERAFEINTRKVSSLTTSVVILQHDNYMLWFYPYLLKQFVQLIVS